MLLVKPDIKISGWCIFCKRHTPRVNEYIYYFYGKGYTQDRKILIRYPAHLFCLLARKWLKYLVLFLGIGFFLALNFFYSATWLGFLTKWELPLWLRIVAGILGILLSLFLFIKIHFKTVGKIHDYYVMNENLPEADKEWRRRLNGRR